MHRKRTRRTYELSKLYLLFMFITFGSHHHRVHYWTIEIGNIFADNTVTRIEGTRAALGSYKQKNRPEQAAKCPENTLDALETPLRAEQSR
jgi:hypothetical protein